MKLIVLIDPDDVAMDSNKFTVEAHQYEAILDEGTLKAVSSVKSFGKLRHGILSENSTSDVIFLSALFQFKK